MTSHPSTASAKGGVKYDAGDALTGLLGLRFGRMEIDYGPTPRPALMTRIRAASRFGRLNCFITLTRTGEMDSVVTPSPIILLILTNWNFLPFQRTKVSYCSFFLFLGLH